MTSDEVWVVSEVIDYAGGEVLAVCRSLEGARAFAEEVGIKAIQKWLELLYNPWRGYERSIEWKPEDSGADSYTVTVGMRDGRHLIQPYSYSLDRFALQN